MRSLQGDCVAAALHGELPTVVKQKMPEPDMCEQRAASQIAVVFWLSTHHGLTFKSGVARHRRTAVVVSVIIASGNAKRLVDQATYCI